MVTQLHDDDFEAELNDDRLLAAELETVARQGGVIRMNEVIEQIIALENLMLPVFPPLRMAPPPSPHCNNSSCLNDQLPPFCRRVDSSDVEKPERSVWPPRRPHLELDEGDYEKKYAEIEPPRRR